MIWFLYISCFLGAYLYFNILVSFGTGRTAKNGVDMPKDLKWNIILFIVFFAIWFIFKDI